MTNLGELVTRPNGTARVNYRKVERKHPYMTMRIEAVKADGILPESKQVLFREMCMKNSEE
jgi:hypothetical protein